MAATPRIKIRDFLGRVRDETVTALADRHGPPQARIVFSSLQLHFTDPHLHYEVWPVRKTGLIEIGLHLEGPQEWSRDLAAQLAARADDLRCALGPAYELEDWTASWCRLHRTLPLRTLTEPLVEEVAAALAQLIDGVEPVLRDVAPPLAPVSTNGTGRRFRRRRRSRRTASA